MADRQPIGPIMDDLEKGIEKDKLSGSIRRLILVHYQQMN